MLLFCFSSCLEFRSWYYFVQDFISLGWFRLNDFSWRSFYLLSNYFFMFILINYLTSLCFNLIYINLFLFLFFILFLFLFINLFIIIFKIRIDNRSINFNILWLKLFFIFIYLILWLFWLLYCHFDHLGRFWCIFSLVLSCFVCDSWLFSIWYRRRSSCSLALILCLIFILVCFRLCYLYLRIYIILLLFKYFRGYLFTIHSLLSFRIIIKCLVLRCTKQLLFFQRLSLIIWYRCWTLLLYLYIFLNCDWLIIIILYRILFND